MVDRDIKGAAPWIVWLACALGILCFFSDARALDPDRMLSQYVREQWNAETGFSGGAVHAITQTPDGYLWIGADGGLLRFDGINFRTVSSSGPVLDLIADADGDLLVRLPGEVLLRHPNGKFASINAAGGLIASYVTAMLREPDGSVLLSDLLMGLLRLRDRKLEVLVSAAVFRTPPVAISLASTSDGRVWIGTLGAGLLYVFQGQVYSVAAALVTDRKTNCLLPDMGNQLWVGTERGLLRWNGTQITPAGFPSLEHAMIMALLRDADSNVWAATDRGLFRINGQGVSFSPENAILGGGAVNTLFEDREGNLWVGGGRGLERIRNSAFVTYSREAGLPAEDNGPVFADSKNRIWSAPATGGLYVLANGRVEPVRAPGLAQDVVYSIAGGKDEIWLGRRNGGLTRLRYERGRVTAQTYTERNGLAQNSVFAVYGARDGTMWAGTLSGGASRLKDGRFITYTAASGLASNTVNSILETRDGTTWFATPNGLSSLAAGSWKTYTSKDGLPSENVNSLLEDSSGVLWIATDKGIAFYSSGKIQAPRETPAPLGEPIFDIAQGPKGSLWIATAHHVVKMNPGSLMGLTNQMDWREYKRSDGLESTEGVRRQKSVVVDALGKVWFSMSRGLSVIDPSHTTGSSAPAIAHVESVLADSSAIDVAEPVRVPPSPKRITFSYTGLNLAAPERVRFRYRLDGFDPSWSEPTASREAVYTNLSPGHYRFRLIACNGDGVWSEPGDVLAFSILSAWYQTFWFLLLCVVAFLLLSSSIYQLRLKRVSAQFNMTLEARVSERTRIARDLHDTLLQTFSASLLRLQSVSRMLPGRPEEAKKRVESAIEQASNAIAEGRDAVHQLRGGGPATVDLAQSINSFVSELAGSCSGDNPPEFHVQVEGTPRNLNPLVHDEAYRIAAEALRNAIQHAGPRHIEVEIRYDEQQLRLRIRDDGKGIDPDVLEQGQLPGHWGLRGMRERAKLLGGNFEVWSRSEAGSGTEVELIVPAASAYLRPASRWSVFWPGWRS